MDHTLTRRAYTDLALLATHNITNSEFSLLLILLILFAAIFFFQGLIRLIIQFLRPKSIQQRQRSWLSPVHGTGGYAVPRQPIRVVLARDEEAAGIESEATKANPPAYGLWRESVVSELVPTFTQTWTMAENILTTDCSSLFSGLIPIASSGSETLKLPRLRLKKRGHQPKAKTKPRVLIL